MTRHLFFTPIAMACFFVCLLAPFFVAATEYAPWFGPEKLVEFRATYQFRHYPKVNTGHRDVSHTGNDNFLDCGLAFTINPQWNVQAEVISAETTKRPFSFEQIRFTGRYLILNDIPGDAPVSLSAGLTLDYASRAALRDIACFHHGQGEAEAHLAIGKESSSGAFWVSRIWGLVGLGIANHGSPWLRGIAQYERNHYDCHRYALFMEALYGFGEHSLKLGPEFHGYGPIRHRSAEVGGWYEYFFSKAGSVKVSYAYRFWARNFPAQAHTLTVCLLIPFGL